MELPKHGLPGQLGLGRGDAIMHFMRAASTSSDSTVESVLHILESTFVLPCLSESTSDDPNPFCTVHTAALPEDHICVCGPGMYAGRIYAA